jgi:hypothetical protein
MAAEEDFGLAEILFIIGGLAAIGYGIYWLVTSGPLAPGTPDPGGGAPSTGVLSSAINNLEVGDSSLSFTDALQQFVGAPLTTLGTIFGFNQGDSSGDSGDNDGTN